MLASGPSAARALLRRGLWPATSRCRAGLHETHQLIRWVNTKEEHAQSIMTCVADDFLAQKVKKAELFSTSRALSLSHLSWPV